MFLECLRRGRQGGGYLIRRIMLGACAAGMIGAMAAPPALAVARHHVVAPGETLFKIAQRELGSGARWAEIAQLNHLPPSGSVKPGQVLTLPGAGTGRDDSEPAGLAQERPRHPLREATFGRDAARLAPRIPRQRRTREGVVIVPRGEVVLELPARSPDRRVSYGNAGNTGWGGATTDSRLLLHPFGSSGRPAPWTFWGGLVITAILLLRREGARKGKAPSRA